MVVCSFGMYFAAQCSWSSNSIIMKKILLAFDGSHFSEGAFNFARQLNDLHRVLLTGIFIPQISYANLWSYADGMVGPAYVPILEKDDTEVVNKNIERFEAVCREQNIPYTVHKDMFDFALPELRRETRFADLLIIGSDNFYENIAGPNDYMKDALQNAECPVIVVPETYLFPQVNVLAYDGSEASVYAIKQFAYLLPELCNQETVLVYSSSDYDELPNQERIEELVKQHFMDVTLLKLDMDPHKDFSKWINNHTNAILVSGSYGRSTISQLFKKSFVDNIITTQKLPVFIAHK